MVLFLIFYFCWYGLFAFLSWEVSDVLNFYLAIAACFDALQRSVRYWNLCDLKQLLSCLFSLQTAPKIVQHKYICGSATLFL